MILRYSALLCLFLLPALPGCASASKNSTGETTSQRSARLLLGHTFEDRRISSEAAEGMVPTGVWRIRGPRNTVYLAATSHLVTTNQIPFPSSYYAAYHDSHEIYLEVDEESSKISNVRLSLQLLKWMRNRRDQFFYPKGQSLADDLAPETLERLKEFYGRDYKKFEHMRPAFLAFMAQATALGNQFIEDGGVEDVFASRARLDRKPIRTLDDRSVNEVVFLALDQMIYEIERDIETSGSDAVVNEAHFGPNEPIDERDWRTGNLAAAQEEIAQMQKDAPELYEKIGPERNRKWLPKILAVLQRDKNAMILAGIAHFPGPGGLLELLRRANYTVEQLYGIDPK
jgi:uncharacterized protein